MVATRIARAGVEEAEESTGEVAIIKTNCTAAHCSCMNNLPQGSESVLHTPPYSLESEVQLQFSPARVLI